MKFIVIFATILCLLLSVIQSQEYDGEWRKSFEGCWTQSNTICNRALTISHGGDWDVQYPYDSFPAFQRAYEKGADTVKGDFRVSLDNIGMVMHSSPIEVYESINCFGKYVEKMTAAECEKCQMEVTNYTFISVPTLLAWAENKVNVFLCVKENSDLPRAITTLIENNATHRAILEIGLSVFVDIYNNPSKYPGWDQVYYVIELNTSQEVANLIQFNEFMKKRGFLFEFNGSNVPTTWGPTLQDDLAKVHNAGYKVTATSQPSPATATVKNQLGIFNAGIDVIYTYNLTNAAEARIEVNTLRSLTPP